MLRAPVSISHTAYEVLWERAELGVMPVAVSISYPVRSLDNGSRMAKEASTELGRAGLVRGERVHPDLAAALRALVNAERRYYGMYLSAASPSGSGPLVAVHGSAAVLAMLDARHLHLRPVPPEKAVAALIAALPPNRPGSGRSLSFRADELSADGRPVRPASARGSVMVPTSVTQGDVDRYVRLMTRPRAAMTYLYSVHDDRRCTHPLIALDIDGDGRWLTSRQPGSGGVEWIGATPATATTMIEQLTTPR
ncbi:MAG: ESX secretion-associated protein EspG [Sciscionella sp.]